MKIRYRSGYKYQLVDDYSVEVEITPPDDIETDFVSLSRSGGLRIRRNYAWDGPSGPTMDTKTAMRGSLIHDALYQLIRLELLPPSWRAEADRTYLHVCKEDGMWTLRTKYHFGALRVFGGPATSPSAEREIMEAP